MPSNNLILCYSLLFLPSIFSCIRVFSNESILRIRKPKYWSFSISPSNKCSGLISFRMDWFDLLVVQGTLKSLLQHHSSKASILQWCRRPGFNLWVRKIPWRREWLLTPVFLPGEFHGQRSLVGYSSRGHKESDMTERLALSLSHVYEFHFSPVNLILPI